ncbi:DUF2471 family protein [Burkholderia anthina]|uniref:DUF2471 family protein n=1 Tax=Burkholderia anthina TaxID=179879 RepID=UPI0037BED8E6
MEFHPAPPSIDLSLHDAASDLTSLIVASVDKRPEFHRTRVESITWRMLIEVETEAFTDASFTSRYADSIVNTFFKVADEYRSIESIDDLVDLKDRDIQKMPFVLAIVSMLLKQRAAKNKRLDS